MMSLRCVLGCVVAAGWVVTACPAEAHVVGERFVLDSCEVGGRGNDIHSLQSHYDRKRDEMVVTLRLCAKAQPKATYRVYLDHAAPFVGRTAASA
ncbi:MAG: hypothetical protein WAS21_08780, partial [Geminicoccaceae bacterium]